MKQLLLLAVLLSVGTAQAALNVVATLPDFASIAEQVGGDKIKVTSIAKGPEDAHFVDARPSFIRLLNQADLLIEGGADLEVGWLPPLVNGARNSKILGNAPGHLMLSRGISLRDLPTGPVDRSMGDVHPSGNPHFWLDPENGKIVAREIQETLGSLDPANASIYATRRADFEHRLDGKLKEWAAQLAPYQGTKVLTYHKSFDYLAARFGLEVTGQIEPKPGIEPSAAHINALIPKAKAAGVKLVIVEPFRPRKTPQHVADQAGAKLLVLPDKTGATPQVKDYFALFDVLVSQLAEAMKAAP